MERPTPVAQEPTELAHHGVMVAATAVRKALETSLRLWQRSSWQILPRSCHSQVAATSVPSKPWEQAPSLCHVRAAEGHNAPFRSRRSLLECCLLGMGARRQMQAQKGLHTQACSRCGGGAGRGPAADHQGPVRPQASALRQAVQLYVWRHVLRRSSVKLLLEFRYQSATV